MLQNGRPHESRVRLTDPFPVRTMVAAYAATVGAGGLFGSPLGPIGIAYGCVYALMTGIVTFAPAFVFTLTAPRPAMTTLAAGASGALTGFMSVWCLAGFSVHNLSFLFLYGGGAALLGGCCAAGAAHSYAWRSPELRDD